LAAAGADFLVSVAATEGFHSMWPDTSIAGEVFEMMDLCIELWFLMMESDELTDEEKVRMEALMDPLREELINPNNYIGTRQDLPMPVVGPLTGITILTDAEDVCKAPGECRLQQVEESQDPLQQLEQELYDVGPLTDCVFECESVCQFGISPRHHASYP